MAGSTFYICDFEVYVLTLYEKCTLNEVSWRFPEYFSDLKKFGSDKIMLKLSNCEENIGRM